MLIHFPVDPVFSIEKWCKAWKLQERVSLDVGIQTVMHVPDQEIEQPVNCKGYVGDRCPTVKLEPTWTSIFLREEQEDYFFDGKKPEIENHCGKMCCLRVVLWRPCCHTNVVLCPKRKSDRGGLTNGHVVLPQRLRQTEFETHHNHTTTSHCGVQNTLSALGKERKRHTPFKKYVVKVPMEWITIDILGTLP